MTDSTSDEQRTIRPLTMPRGMAGGGVDRPCRVSHLDWCVTAPVIVRMLENLCVEQYPIDEALYTFRGEYWG